jgi:hypothetical protein
MKFGNNKSFWHELTQKIFGERQQSAPQKPNRNSQNASIETKSHSVSQILY